MKPDETNPFKHPFPHARLRRQLTSISRLNKGPWPENWLISDDDPRNYPITRASELAALQVRGRQFGRAY